jgi:hypothetical protein
MTGTGKTRLTSKQIRILAGVWVGVVVLVGVCTFLGILWALKSSNEEAASPAEGDQPIVPQGAQTTPTQPLAPGDAAATQVLDTPLPQPTIPPRQDRSFGYGIQSQFERNTDPTLGQVEQLGMNWIKQQIRWADLEPVQGSPNWDALDALFTATSKHNIKVLASVVAAPDWARSVTGDGKVGPPDDPQTFANYISQLIQRYPGMIHAIEVWNEPNLSERGWYTGGTLNAQDYIDLLAPTAQAIREADPNIIIVSAALAPTGVNDGVIAIDDFVYTQQMIDVGLLDYVDCVGAHANGINLPPDVAYDAGYNDPTAIFRGPFDNPHHSWSFYSTLRGYHDLIVAAGGDTPVCVTEFGWATLEGMEGEPLRPDFDFAYDNSLEEQADNIVNAFQSMHDWGFVWFAILFNLDYSPKNGGDPKADSTMFSIVMPDGSPRPAFEALRDMPKPP